MGVSDFSDLAEGAFGIVMTVLSVFLLGILVAGIMYLVTLRNALNAVSPALRKVHPDNVFLLMIPLFNLVYYFFIIGYVADSLAAEMRQRNMPLVQARPTYGIGLATAILYFVTLIPILGSLASIGWLVCWIIHWVQVADAKNKILANGGGDVLDQGLTP